MNCTGPRSSRTMHATDREGDNLGTAAEPVETFHEWHGLPLLSDRRVSRHLVADAVAIADAVVILVASALAFYLYVIGELQADQLVNQYVGASVFAVIAYTAFMRLTGPGLESRLANVGQMMRHAIQSLSLMLVTWMTVGFLTKSMALWSRGWIVLWLGFSIVGLLLVRLVLRLAIRHWRRTERWQDRVAIVGVPSRALRSARIIQRRAGKDVRIVGLFDDRAADRMEHGGIKASGTVDDLIAFIRDNHVDAVILDMPWSWEERIFRLCDQLGMMPVDIHLVLPSRSMDALFPVSTTVYGVPSMQIITRPLSDRQMLIKRTFDLVVGGLITLAVSPLILLVAVAIRLESKGPALFVQPRHGFKDTVFNIYKFRTMYTEMCDPTGRVRTNKGDSRVTTVGRLLRRWSVDELPQLFNVLKGDMSLVGPRPHPVNMQAADREYREVVVQYAARHRMKPGITGRSQVKGLRGAADTEDKALRRVECDLEYIANWSVWEDVWIMIQTAWAVVRGDGAY